MIFNWKNLIMEFSYWNQATYLILSKWMYASSSVLQLVAIEFSRISSEKTIKN